MKKIISLLLLTLTLGTLQAQNDSRAKEVLDKALATFNRKGGAEIAFTSSGTQGLSGTICVKGNKFFLQTARMTTWYDGKTQWTYLKDSYKKGYSYRYGGLSGNQHKIVLTPGKGQKSDLKSITLWIKNASYTPAKVLITDRNGQSTTIQVTRYTPKSFPESTFRFNAQAYPQAEIIDLR